MKVVHYLNQFFGGVGGEEEAGSSLEVRDGPVGPGAVLQQALGDEWRIVATMVCGDNHAAERLDEIGPRVVAAVKQAGADLFVAGPCFDAGRYGVAAGALCAAVRAELEIPAITAMSTENPGADLYRRQVLIVDSGGNVARMRDVMSGIARVAIKLVSGEAVGPPSEEGYIPQGVLRPAFAEKTAAERLVDMLVAKTNGEPFESEVPLDPFPPVPMPPPVRDLSKARVALVTDGGLVPTGNPDGFPRSGATVWAAYDISGTDDLTSDGYEVQHGGYDNRPVQEDPDRLVPIDVLRELEREGVIGKLHEEFLSTPGNVAPLENGQRVGREMLARLQEAGVDAVVLTST